MVVEIEGTVNQGSRPRKSREKDGRIYFTAPSRECERNGRERRKKKKVVSSG
jgi:hypothetical protein